MTRPCVHADQIQAVEAAGEGCETCLELGDTWVHLRQCLTCGRTLCCDDSKNRHMSRHSREVGHPIMRSAEPGEDWIFCFPDDAPIREAGTGWETYHPFVEAGIWVAGEHLAHGGRLDDPDLVTDDGFPLGSWQGYVRSQQSEGELDPSYAAEIEALPGWHW